MVSIPSAANEAARSGPMPLANWTDRVRSTALPRRTSEIEEGAAGEQAQPAKRRRQLDRAADVDAVGILRRTRGARHELGQNRDRDGDAVGVDIFYGQAAIALFGVLVARGDIHGNAAA